MKKLLTTFILFASISYGVFAQNRVGNLPSPDKYVTPLSSNKTLLNNSNRFYTRYAGSQWFSYFNAIAAFNNLTTAALSNTYLFPDTEILAIYGAGATTSVGSPFVHSIATVLDPKSTLFSSVLNPGDMIVGPGDSYTVDSVAFPFAYFRNDPDTLVVDTLELTVFTGLIGTHNFFKFFFTGAFAQTNYNVDSVIVPGIIYSHATNDPILNAPIVHIKIPMNQASLGDTTAGGGGGISHSHLAKISTSALGTLPAGYLVGASANFIPGYTYDHSDTVNNLNYIIFTSLLENGPNTLPTYVTHDYNQSYIINNSVRYNSDTLGYDSLYVPSISFLPGYVLQDHPFSFLLGCSSCFGLGVKDVKNQDAQLIVSPNPSSTDVHISYSLDKASNVTLQVTDLSGRVIISKPLSNQSAGVQDQVINVSKFPSGVYFCSVKTNTGTINEKFVVTR